MVHVFANIKMVCFDQKSVFVGEFGDRSDCGDSGGPRGISSDPELLPRHLGICVLFYHGRLSVLASKGKILQRHKPPTHQIHQSKDTD